MKKVPTQPVATRLESGLERLAAVLREGLWRQAWPRDLTATQARILERLRIHPGTTVRRLSRALGIRDSTASDALTSLAEKGLVTKESDPEDRRRRLLRLSPEGEGAAADVGDARSFLGAALDELTGDERETFVVLLQKVIRGLQRSGRIPVEGTCLTCRYFRPHVHDHPRLPHHCAYVDAAFGDADLRFDCPEQEPLAELQTH